jgi:hypothetical protein
MTDCIITYRQEKLQKVWKTKGEARIVEMQGKKMTRPYYLSVNAVTLEPNEDIDLIKWHDKGWIFYVQNWKDKPEDMRVGEPHEGGMY